MVRVAISKRVRFEVFKRDSFSCQYCGSMPPKVPLEVDHIVPVSKGGKNDLANLITACFDCNRGKSKVELSSVPETMASTIERNTVANQQYKQYNKVLDDGRKMVESDINAVEAIYSRSFNDYQFTEKFRTSVKTFIQNLGVHTVESAMDVACLKIHYDEQKVLKYFCGICWTWIRERQ